MHSPDQVLSAEQMRSAEDARVTNGVSIAQLIERAGLSAADWIWRVASGRGATVLCGPGNNGADGYVLAEALQRRGLAVKVVAPMAPMGPDARNARAIWSGAVSESAHQDRGGVFVDCLFGTGLSRPLLAEHEALLNDLASRHDVTVAIDLPSGVSTDDGSLLGKIPKADLTLALGAWKPAHFRMPARERMGTVRLVDIGIGGVEGSASVFPRPRLETPGATDHKYTRGLVGVVGGAMPGAALLAAGAAQRSGAGYVKLIAHKGVPLPASLVIDDRPIEQALSDARWSALLVGPGLGRDDTARSRLAAVIERGVPTVLDANALHLLDDDALEGADPSRILLTPHKGELATLCRAFGIEERDKCDRAKALATRTGLTVLAKGPDTLLAAGDGRLAYFAPATAWLATAGTGDVLAGIAASRLATRHDPFVAAGEAVWLHGEAAHLAGAAFTANDMICEISRAYERFL